MTALGEPGDGAEVALSNEPRLRAAGPADIPAMAQTVVEGFKSYLDFAPVGWRAPSRQVEFDYLEHHLDQDGTWATVAELPGGSAVDAGGIAVPNLVGHAMVRRGSQAVPGRGRVGTLGQLFVRAPWWGTGLAAELLAAAVGAAPYLGYEELRLSTPAAQARARRFYEREGWEAAGDAHFDAAAGLELVIYRRAVG